MTRLITPQLVKQRVDQIRAMPSADRPKAIAVLNSWLVEGMEQNRIQDPQACATVALSVLEE